MPPTSAITPLRLIFWGGLLWLIDVRINSFDLFDDTLATVLITAGIAALARAPVPPPYPGIMAFLQLVSVGSICSTAIKHFSIENDLVSLVLSLFSFAQLIATALFAHAMRLFCLHASLDVPARSWRTTTHLFLWIYVVPLGLLYAASLIATALRAPFNIRLGLSALLLLVLLAIPLFHLFLSTSRMRRSAAAAIEPTFETLPT